MPLTMIVEMDGKETEKETERGKEGTDKTKRNHDGAFVDLTKQFKRLSCPFNALKSLAKGRRIAITEALYLEWTEITQTRLKSFFLLSTTRNGAYLSVFYDLAKDRRSA